MRPISLASLALLAAVSMAGSAQAQTAAQPAAAPAAAAPAASSSQGGGKLSHDCKEEVKKACGRAHGDEMQNCIKSSMDLNKFSDSCKTEIQKQAAAKKPSS